MKADVKISRDIAKFPSTVDVSIGQRKLHVDFDPEKGFIIEGQRGILPTFSDVLKMIYPVTSVLTVRGLNWFDRNPEGYAYGGISVAEGPHASKVRHAYTCPADKITVIEVLDVGLKRITAAAVPGASVSWWTLTREGEASSAHFLHSWLSPTENNVNDKDVRSLGGTITLFEGDKMEWHSEDGATGGTIVYEASYKLTEFDA